MILCIEIDLIVFPYKNQTKNEHHDKSLIILLRFKYCNFSNNETFFTRENLLAPTTFVLHRHSRHSRPALAEKSVHSCGDHVKGTKQLSAHEHFVPTHVCVILAYCPDRYSADRGGFRFNAVWTAFDNLL
ncbi:hypothetical protein CR513_24729, partial [Mucuna pruriens]